MRLEVHVSLDGAAFQDGLRDYETGQILRTLAERFETGNILVDEVRRLHDCNGNRVGFAVVTESEPT